MNLDSVIKQAKKIRWEWYGTYSEPYLMDSIINDGTAIQYLASLGYGKRLFNFHLMIDGKYYWATKDYEQNILKYLKLSWHKGGLSFLAEFYRFNEKETLKTEQEVNNLAKLPIDSFDNKRTAETFQSWVKAVQPIMSLNVIFDQLTKAIEPRIYGELSKLIKKKDNVNLVLIEITPPKGLSKAFQEEDDLLIIAQEIVEHKELLKKFSSNSTHKDALDTIKQFAPEIAKKISTHQQKYAWLRVYDWWGPVYAIHYFVDRIIKMLKDNPEETLRKKKTERRQKEQYMVKRLEQIKATKSLRSLVEKLRDLTWLFQAQWEVVSISGYRARPLLSLIGQRLGGLTYEEVIQLTYSEIEDLLTANQKADKSLIKERLAHRGMLRLGSKTYLLKGEEVIKIKNRLIPKQVKITTNIIKGNPSYAGIVSGKVRIIPTIRDLSRMKDGEILVCPMTNPDYMPAIRKAKGIVTDDGGILCHAAIISRELKIPCIVGTKIATQVLKDGDLVEVNANNGIVRILR